MRNAKRFLFGLLPLLAMTQSSQYNDNITFHKGTDHSGSGKIRRRLKSGSTLTKKQKKARKQAKEAKRSRRINYKVNRSK